MTPPPMPAADPCLDCGCCAGWEAMLETLRASIVAHLAKEWPRREPCDPECLVCQAVEWQTPG